MAWARCEQFPRRRKLIILTGVDRFVLTTTDGIKQRQVKEAEDIKTEMANLEKKMHYLDTTFKNSQEHLQQILQRGG